MLRVPYNPPLEQLHIYAQTKPLPIQYTILRLGLVSQLISSQHNLELQTYPNSKLSRLILADITKFTKTRNLSQPLQLEKCDFTKSKIHNYGNKLWQDQWVRYCRNNDTSYGLLHLIKDKTSLITNNPVPISQHPRLVGSICALLSGHTRLQLHTYKLKLTYSPTCICLAEDETSEHYVVKCKLYDTLRQSKQPSIEDWDSIISFIESTGRFP